MRLEHICKCFQAPSKLIDVEQPTRTICTECSSPFLVRVDAVLNRPEVSLTNEKFTPFDCHDALARAYPLPISEINDSTVSQYADLMLHFRWQTSLIGQGGYLAPIMFVNGRLLLGATRFKAAKLAHYFLYAAVIRLTERPHPWLRTPQAIAPLPELSKEPLPPSTTPLPTSPVVAPTPRFLPVTDPSPASPDITAPLPPRLAP